MSTIHYGSRVCPLHLKDNITVIVISIMLLFLCPCCRFQPERGFAGADAGQSREGPVQFEKDVEEDPFGLNKFLTEAKKAKRPADDSR